MTTPDHIHEPNRSEITTELEFAHKQAVIAEVLHTYVGGAASYATNCPRCMDLARQIVQIDGSWSRD